MQSHEDLKVWQESMNLVEDVYALTRDFPREEGYGLVSQLRRSAISIPSNIAEGAGRGGSAEWIRFLNIAQGPLSELDTQLQIAKRLGYIREYVVCYDRIIYIRKMITNLKKRIKV